MLTDLQLAEIRAAAHEGGLLMDEKVPGWTHRVDPGVLNMSSSDRCVLGQSIPSSRTRFFNLYGLTYSEKLDWLGITPADQCRYGFSLPIADTMSGETWRALANAWRKEIAARTTVTTPSQVGADGQALAA